MMSMMSPFLTMSIDDQERGAEYEVDNVHLVHEVVDLLGDEGVLVV